METEDRIVVPVNESIIHDIMAGDVPRSQQVGEPPHTKEPSIKTGTQDAVISISRPRKRKEQREYGDIFLEKLAPMPRKHTYISLKMYDELSELLPVIARGVSIPNFLENLLRHHFEAYRDDINELYEAKTKKRY